MRAIKNILSIVAFCIFLFALVLPAAIIYFALTLIMALFEAFGSGVETARDILDESMNLLCEVFQDWLP